MKKIYFFIGMLLCSMGVWGQQVIGTFPYMDGGFEGQATAALGTALSATAWTRQNQAGASSSIVTTTPRTGLKYATITNVATASRGLQSPQTTIPANGPQASTSYTIQYYIKNPSIATYTESINTNGTTNPAYGAAVTVAANATWTKRTVTQTSAANAVVTAGILVTARSASAVIFEIDDVVLYAGAVDNTLAANPGAVSVINPTNTALDVSWGTASGGVDGGGYVVVRYTAIPGATDDPNQNGIYAVGNTVTGGVNGTVAYIGTATSFTDAGLSSATTYYYKVYTVDKAFNYSGETEANGTTTAAVPDIVLSSPGQVAAGNIAQGTTNNVIYHFDLAVTIADATLNGVTINTLGTYLAADITNFKCWYSADAIFSPGTDVLVSTITPVSITGPQVFPTVNRIITTGTTGYIFITADLPCTASITNDISVSAITTADISFAAGTKSGTSSAGGLQTIIAATPNNVTGAAATVANASSSIGWTVPAGCYDDILIVAATAANTWIPSGTTYVGSLVFGAGAPLGNGFVVYQGTGSPQVVSGLTNGIPYYYKIFTRFGSTWSAGVEVSATPAVVTLATDYFRSIITGNWGSTTTWESSSDNISWMNATLVPDANANTITIRNGHNVTVAAIAGGDQMIIDAGATLMLSANFTLADGAATDLSVDGTIINNAGTHVITGTIAFNASSLYQHNRNGGSILIATWATTATAEITGNTSSTSMTSGVNQAFGNFVWNSPGQTVTLNLVGALSTVNGNFRVQNVGTGTLRLTASAVLSLTVAGNYIVEANHDIDNNATGASDISIGGNFSHTGGLFQSSGNLATITMTGVGKTFTQSGGTFTSTNLNWIIGAGASTTLNNNLPISATRSVIVNGLLDASTLQITGAGDVSIIGTLRTANADGLELTGTLANLGVKSLGVASTIDYYAAGAQIFSTRTDYANVIINGGGNKTLNGVATLSGNFTLTNGYVVSTAVNLITLTNTASVTGASNASFVNGPVSKIGNTNFTFPVGKPNCGPSATVNGYAAIAITNATGSAVTDQYTAEYIRGSAVLLGTITALGLNHVSGCDYWTLNQVAGTSTVDVTLSWDDAINNCSLAGPYVNNLPSLVVAHFDATNWNTFGGVGTAIGSSASGSITWPGVSVFSPFAIGSVDFTNPLPISINYFTGAKNNGNHLLNWKLTCVSSPSASIDLERSVDGRTYNSIYSVYATALRCQQPFNYTDQAPAKGVNYYRLKMTDANGKVTYSSVVSLINAIKGIELMNISPNPIVNSAFNLNISAAAKTQMDLVITDMQGRVMQRQSVPMIAGFNQIPVTVKNLAAGTYQLVGNTADGRTRVLRFVIQ